MVMRKSDHVEYLAEVVRRTIAQDFAAFMARSWIASARAW